MKKISCFIIVNFILILLFAGSLSRNLFQDRMETYAYVKNAFIISSKCNSILPDRFNYLFFRNGYYVYAEKISFNETKWVKIPADLTNYLDEKHSTEKETLDSLIGFVNCIKKGKN